MCSWVVLAFENQTVQMDYSATKGKALSAWYLSKTACEPGRVSSNLAGHSAYASRVRVRRLHTESQHGQAPCNRDAGGGPADCGRMVRLAAWPLGRCVGGVQRADRLREP